MIDLIPSKTVKDYIEKDNISFTEEWATIIYNLGLDVEKTLFTSF